MLNRKYNQRKIFKGENAIADYLVPDSMGPTPVVELPAHLNPFTKDKVRIFIKLSQFLPLGNIKSLPAYMMLKSLSKKDISEINNLVEYSSGNTVLSLAILSKHFGIPNLHAIITPDVPEHKKRLLRLVGANLLISHGNPSPGVFDKEGGIHEAKLLGGKKGWHNFNQYVNENNPKSSSLYIGKELWSQLGEDLSIFLASMGTAGTITGAGKFLKNKNSKIHVVGAAIKENSSIPGPRGEVMIHKLGIPWESVVDEVIAIDTKSAYEQSLSLIRTGLFVGPSTGMQLSALLQKLKEYKKKNKLKNLRNKNGEVLCCFTACDTMFPYIDEYFTVLPSSNFSKIKKI